MDKIAREKFKFRRILTDKLESFGFVKNEDKWLYKAIIADNQLELAISIDGEGDIFATAKDLDTGDPYTLFLVDGAEGGFVGEVRGEYEKLLSEIAEKCSEPEIFKSAQAKEIIAYVEKTYGRSPEYLWKKFPDNAVWRRADNEKWFGAILTTSKDKLSLPSRDAVEILDVRMDEKKLDDIFDGKKYFRGWHMNKRSWATVCLDGSISSEEIFRLIDDSYILAAKK